jgi:hypothetical protein
MEFKGSDYDIDWRQYTINGISNNEEAEYIVYAPSAIQAWISGLNNPIFKPTEITRYYEHD